MRIGIITTLYNWYHTIVCIRELTNVMSSLITIKNMSFLKSWYNWLFNEFLNWKIF
jgi:hypothetical protein